MLVESKVCFLGNLRKYVPFKSNLGVNKIKQQSWCVFQLKKAYQLKKGPIIVTNSVQFEKCIFAGLYLNLGEP